MSGKVEVENLLDIVTRGAAWGWIRRSYHPAGPVCPGCGSPITGARALAAWSDLRKVYCAGCGCQFRPTVGTPLHETSWQPEEYIQLLLLAAVGRKADQIAATLGKSGGCIRDMLDRVRLRHAAPSSCSAGPCQSGIQRESAAKGAGLDDCQSVAAGGAR